MGKFSYHWFLNYRKCWLLANSCIGNRCVLSWRHKELRFSHLSLFVTASYGVCLLSLWIEIDRLGFPRGQSCCSGKQNRMSFHLSLLFHFVELFRYIRGFRKLIVNCLIRLLDWIRLQRFFLAFLLSYLASYMLGTPQHGLLYFLLLLYDTEISHNQAISVT